MTTHVPALELRGIHKRYDEKIVLDDVNLTLRAGEFFALVGPSGSGKSTVLRLVSGIETPDAGEVWLCGKNVTRLPPYHRAVHTVFQNYALFPHLDVAGNVDFPLRVAGMARHERESRVRQALTWVKLEELGSRPIEQLSGGQQQRVALARALVREPRCVLLDEPLAALDAHLRGHTLELLRELQARLDVTYLYVTHDRDEALRAAHRIGVLHGGQLQQVGTPEEIYHRPRTAFVAEFVGPINWLRGVVEYSSERPGVRLASGPWVPLTDCQLSGPVRLGVRPAEVVVSPEGGLPARVAGKDFRGDTTVVTLSVQGDVSLRAEMRTSDNCPEIGTEVRVSWSTQAAHVFRDDHA